MATLVGFHAHPDDESVLCGGTLALAARAGHRVVLVCATDGAQGECPDGVLRPGQTLAELRRTELDAAAALLGIARVVHLGYRDSGMSGTPANRAEGSFASGETETAAERLASVLNQERAEVLTVYDRDGTYGHPDHVQVHRVGVRASELAATPYVFEATLNRDRLARMRALADPGATAPAGAAIGLPERELTTAVEVGAVLAVKRAAIAAHASQYPDGSFFRTLPTEAFAVGFGTEWYRQRPGAGQPRTADLFGAA